MAFFFFFYKVLNLMMIAGWAWPDIFKVDIFSMDLVFVLVIGFLDTHVTRLMAGRKERVK